MDSFSWLFSQAIKIFKCYIKFFAILSIFPVLLGFFVYDLVLYSKSTPFVALLIIGIIVLAYNILIYIYGSLLSYSYIGGKVIHSNLEYKRLFSYSLKKIVNVVLTGILYFGIFLIPIVLLRLLKVSTFSLGRLGSLVYIGLGIAGMITLLIRYQFAPLETITEEGISGIQAMRSSGSIIKKIGWRSSAKYSFYFFLVWAFSYIAAPLLAGIIGLIDKTAPIFFMILLSYFFQIFQMIFHTTIYVHLKHQEELVGT